MNMTRWEPYRELATLQDRLNRAFGTAFGRERDDEVSMAAWVPPVDIAEEKDRIMITAELPGFKEDQIEIQSENGMLTLRGERKFEKEHDGRNYHRVERSYGQFVRSFALPNNIDREHIRADFSDGLLKIELPKREDAKPRTIRITPGNGEKKSETVDVKAR